MSDSTPVEAVRDLVPLAVGPKADLFAMSRAMERRALDMTEPCVILSAFQTADRFTPATAKLYSELASRSAFVGAFGHGLSSEPAPGVRGASLPDNHRLLGEWDVIIVGRTTPARWSPRILATREQTCSAASTSPW